MKKTLYATVIAGLTIGWGLFFYKYQESTTEKLVRQNKKLTQEAKQMTETGNGRIGKIGDMVNRSIAMDNEAVSQVDLQITGLNDRIEKMKMTIAQLSDEKSGLKGRLAKLHKVLNVLDVKSNYAAPTTQEVTTNDDGKKNESANSAPRELTLAEKIVLRMNRDMKENVAEVNEYDSSLVVSLKGDKFLIIDDKPARVSAEKSAFLVPFFNTFTKAHGVEQVYLRVKEGTSISQVLVLSAYLKNQFGWDAKIVPVSKDSKNSSLEIDIMAGKKVSAEKMPEKTEPKKTVIRKIKNKVKQAKATTGTTASL